MKYLISLALISALSITSCQAAPKKPNGTEQKPDRPDNKPVEPEKELAGPERQAVVSYFKASLSGGKAPALLEKALELNSLDQARKEVWSLWAQSNDPNETGLPALSPLTANSSPRSWVLSPESYGRDRIPAIMPYYYGAKGDKPSAGYPLFLYLHGSGPKAHEWKTGLALALSFQDSPSVYFIPQIPNGEGVADGQLYRWWQRSKLEAWEKLLRLSFLSGSIDPKRIYFFGISEGGYGSQRLASYYADYLAGAGPMAGGEPLINAPVENLQHIAFSLRTGANDTQFHRNELTGYTREALQRMAAAHPGYYKHFIDIIPKYGHAIPYGPTTPYLAQHQRTALPKSVHWEDFPVDGLYRKSFYNLVPLTRPQGTDRIYYEEEIKDNTVDLKIRSVKYQDSQVSSYYTSFRLVLLYDKTYTDATGGKLRVYLSPELVDLSRPVRIRVNGREVYSGAVRADWKHLTSSCALFFDPLRLFPAAVEVDY